MGALGMRRPLQLVINLFFKSLFETTNVYLHKDANPELVYLYFAPNLARIHL